MVGERFKLRDDLLEFPERGIRKLMHIRATTNLRSTTLLSFSA
jgi:hypothetical protein